MSVEAPPAGTMVDTGNGTLNQPVPDPRDHGEEEGGPHGCITTRHICAASRMNLEACGRGACPERPEFVHVGTGEPSDGEGSARPDGH